MRAFQITAAAGAFVASIAAADAAGPVPVTTCGQVVRGVGQLTADLDCSAAAGEAVHLTGRLLLNGFTLTGTTAYDVVRCEIGACRVVGPGTVTGGADGVRSDTGARVEGGAVVTSNAGDGVRTEKSAKVFGASVTANGGDGVRSKSTATLREAIITGNAGDGVRTDGSATIKTSTVDANGGNGVDSEKSALAKLSSVSGNGFDGLRGLKAKLLDSTAIGNGTDPTCGVSDDCADVASALRPSVNPGATCGTSRNTEANGTWGVCTND